MKKTLATAPLVHVLIHLRFSGVAALKNISPELQKTLHESMVGEGLAEEIVSEAEQVDFIFDPIAQQMRHKKTTLKRLLFRAEGEQEIVEVSDSSIIYKTTLYTGFDAFHRKFSTLLSVLLSVIPNLEKSLMKNVGLRYVDVLVPSDNYKLRDFVSPTVLPPLFDNEGELLQARVLKVTKSEKNQVLVVSLEELPVHNNQVYKVLPDNLIEPDDKCALIISGQASWLKVTADSYGLLDIDHTYEFAGSPKFDETDINTAVVQLYKKSSEVFWQSLSEQAKEAWGYKE